MRDGGDGRIYALITWKLTRCIDIIADYTSKMCTPVIARAREAQYYDERDNSVDYPADGHITIIRKLEQALQALGHSRSYLLKNHDNYGLCMYRSYDTACATEKMRSQL